MGPFDHLYEQQLNELNLGDLGQRAAMSVERGMNNLGNKALAKLGSATAKGKLTQAALLKHIHKEFRVFCGEQGIRNPVVDDVLTFLKVKIDLSVDDKVYQKLAYGDDAQPRNAAGVKGALTKFASEIEDGNAPGQQIAQALINIAKEDTGNEIAIRRGLHQLAREYPSMHKAFAPVADLIGGKAISYDRLDRIFDGVSRFILLKGKGGAEKGEDKKGEKGKDGEEPTKEEEGAAINNNLSEPDCEWTGPEAMANKRFLMNKELVSYGLNLKQYYDWGMIGRKQPGTLNELLDRKYSDVMCVKIARVGLQQFAAPKYRHLLEPLIKECEEAGIADFRRNLIRCLDRMLHKPYSRNEINRELFTMVKGEERSAAFLANVMICFIEGFTKGVIS